MAFEEKKYLGQAGVERLITNIRLEIKEADDAAVASANEYADSLAENYDAAGTAATKVQELADGQVKLNKEAIEKLNGDASTAGSVAKAVSDMKAIVDADVDALEEKVNKNTRSIGALEGLETTDKDNLVDAINEVRNSVSAGGVAAQITVVESTTGLADGIAKAYTIKQGDAAVGTINIPKDMVVQSGEVLVNPEGQEPGTYIKLILANATNDEIYVNVGTLVDVYKAKANATQIQLAIDSATREISASVVAGSIGTTELADASVTTIKIADGNVTKAKLSTEVQASLAKADVAEQNAKDYADDLNEAMDARVKATEEALAEGGSIEQKIATAKGEAVATAAEDATAKANKALEDAKAYADEKVGGVDLSGIATNTQDIADLKTRMGEAEKDIDDLEASLAEGGATANAIADAKKAGTDAQQAVNDLAASLVEITAADIDAMFAAE